MRYTGGYHPLSLSIGSLRGSSPFRAKSPFIPPIFAIPRRRLNSYNGFIYTDPGKSIKITCNFIYTGV
jgi:hypothetical protein